ncbi:hypothetical protein E4T42_08223 [Aureobasidium subglaciale]|nr:hypothetical protein E4T42_08223 [Aureobasidium subglaciale]
MLTSCMSTTKISQRLTGILLQAFFYPRWLCALYFTHAYSIPGKALLYSRDFCVPIVASLLVLTRRLHLPISPNACFSISALFNKTHSSQICDSCIEKYAERSQAFIRLQGKLFPPQDQKPRRISTFPSTTGEELPTRRIMAGWQKEA